MLSDTNDLKPSLDVLLAGSLVCDGLTVTTLKPTFHPCFVGQGSKYHATTPAPTLRRGGRFRA